MVNRQAAFLLIALFMLSTTCTSFALGQEEKQSQPESIVEGEGSERDGLIRSLFPDKGTSWLAGLEESDEFMTMGNRIWAAPAWERRTGRDGIFPVDGDLDGVAVGWRTRNIATPFLSVEAVFLNGGFEPTSGGRTVYEEWQFETLFGYTWTNDEQKMFVTPYTGIRYRNAHNSLGAPLNLAVDQDVWTVPLGVRVDWLRKERMTVGIDARMQWKFHDEQVVSGAFSVEEKTKDELTYRLAVPVTFKFGERTEVELRPYYEWDRFSSDSSTRTTKIGEYGGQITFLLRY